MARLNKGRKQVQQALSIFQNQGNKWGQAYSNRVLGMLAIARGDLSSAACYYRRALDHCMPQDVEYAHCLRELGNLGLHQGKKTDAKIHLTHAMDIYITHDYPSGREQIEKLLLETVECLKYILHKY
jgi:tetratricopeptide (TPR) repeat protein